MSRPSRGTRRSRQAPSRQRRWCFRGADRPAASV